VTEVAPEMTDDEILEKFGASLRRIREAVAAVFGGNAQFNLVRPDEGQPAVEFEGRVRLRVRRSAGGLVFWYVEDVADDGFVTVVHSTRSFGSALGEFVLAAADRRYVAWQARAAAEGLPPAPEAG
jgi:hypothetical protein